LFGFLHGHILNELQELVENPDETDDLLRLGLHRLPIKDFPLLRSLAPALASYDGGPNLNAASTSSSRGSPPHWLFRIRHGCPPRPYRPDTGPPRCSHPYLPNGDRRLQCRSVHTSSP
jgi:hypothetical protein